MEIYKFDEEIKVVFKILQEYKSFINIQITLSNNGGNKILSL